MVTRVVKGSSNGNALSYGLSIFGESQKLPYPSVIPNSVRFPKLYYLLVNMGSFPNFAFSNVQIYVK